MVFFLRNISGVINWGSKSYLNLLITNSMALLVNLLVVVIPDSYDSDIDLSMVSMFLNVSIVELSISSDLCPPSTTIDSTSISIYFLNTIISAENPCAIISYSFP